MRNEKGFTLIELLVVIAIIAILAAILFPVFIAAKANAVKTQCMGNLKQIALGTNLYLDDFDSRYPLYYTQKYYGWVYAAQKYSKSKIITKCPSDSKSKKSDNIVTYWRNTYTDNRATYQTTWAPPTELQIIHRKTTVYIMDGPYTSMNGSHTWWGPPTTFSDGYSKYPDYRVKAPESEERHAGGANVLFCDWHVGWVKRGNFKTTKKNTGATCPIKKYYGGGWAVQSPWDEANDGSNPWFRGD